MASPRIEAVREPAPIQSGHGVLRLVNRVRVELIDALDRELSPFDISAPQLFVLSSVANREADSAAGLCR